MADPFVDWNVDLSDDDQPGVDVLADALHHHYPVGERALIEDTPSPVGPEDGEQPPEPPVRFE